MNPPKRQLSWNRSSSRLPACRSSCGLRRTSPVRRDNGAAGAVLSEEASRRDSRPACARRRAGPGDRIDCNLVQSGQSPIPVMSRPRRKDFQSAAEVSGGGRVLVLNGGTETDIAAAFAMVVEQHVSALLIGADSFFKEASPSRCKRRKAFAQAGFSSPFSSSVNFRRSLRMLAPNRRAKCRQTSYPDPSSQSPTKPGAPLSPDNS
jgi:hypothetical protein